MKYPPSLEHFDEHQQSYYERLQELKSFMLFARPIEGFLEHIIACGHFCMRRHFRALEGILQSGGLKNSIEVGGGATFGGKEVRQQVVRALFNVDPTQLKAEDYPRYGYLSGMDPDKDVIFNSEMGWHYGDVLITFKKDQLFHRTTLTVGDSVNFGRCYTMIPTRVDRVRATCLCGLEHDGKALQKIPNPIAAYMYFASLILKKRITEKNFSELEEIASKDAPPIFEFFELQYHGPLTLEDIERIDVLLQNDEEEQAALTLKPRYEECGIPFHISHGLEL